MSKVNVWWVIGREDEQCCFNYSQVTPKGEWINSYEEAVIIKEDLQKLTKDKLVVLKRTCEVLK